MTPSQIKALRSRYKSDDGTPIGREDFSRLVGVCHMTVWRWEHGKGKPSRMARRRLEAMAREAKQLSS